MLLGGHCTDCTDLCTHQCPTPVPRTLQSAGVFSASLLSCYKVPGSMFRLLRNRTPEKVASKHLVTSLFIPPQAGEPSNRPRGPEEVPRRRPGARAKAEAQPCVTESHAAAESEHSSDYSADQSSLPLPGDGGQPFLRVKQSGLQWVLRMPIIQVPSQGAATERWCLGADATPNICPGRLQDGSAPEFSSELGHVSLVTAVLSG